ncbi:metal-dependent transcriptional regulator [Luteipulveratus sp. YIM 133132]|uniref:Metal-dependent transcriptional regulator n=1 Tax=Luteipulveratus flavus TaxID=3031728 RepID=A0ABT6C490_9MICO|nr:MULTISPECIES: metal-dependent transcriptional regulator [unclassified Luteipulveratus]MDE9364205.1 metal-dependent transcriptional regulator [Luteipulveratus sp. YIM 133132]MDF8263633.1 metal-dependent transcriptional regulator [Luteipulveratus sp. YIM 133296]
MTDLIDTTEMYLRTIFDLEEEGIVPLRARIAERLGHSGPTVSQTVARMERDGLLTLAGDRHIELTEHGRTLATRVMRKHRLAERLLVDVIGLELEYVHDEACRWEHVMSERVERKILDLLKEHQLSPYGNPIPGLEELGEDIQTEQFRDGVASLIEVAEEQEREVLVRRIGEPAQADHQALTVLTGAGVQPGVRILVRRENGRVLAVAAGRDAGEGASLPPDVASHVFVAVP